jgi:hypothetical protein
MFIIFVYDRKHNKCGKINKNKLWKFLCRIDFSDIFTTIPNVLPFINDYLFFHSK